MAYLGFLMEGHARAAARTDSIDKIEITEVETCKIIKPSLVHLRQ